MLERERLAPGISEGVGNIAKKIVQTGTNWYLDWKKDRNVYTTPDYFLSAINELAELNIALPRDSLYGFVFPSTLAVAQRYQIDLNTEIESRGVPRAYVVQETYPKTLVRKWRLRLDIEALHTTPAVLRAHDDEDFALLYLPPYYESTPKGDILTSVYHEGLHLLYQRGRVVEKGDAQGIFDTELDVNIAEVLLTMELLKRGYEFNAQEFLVDVLVGPYETAVQEEDRTIFERHFKQLYELADDCVFRGNSPPY